MLVARHDGGSAFAWSALKGRDYTCPECESALTLRQGAVKIHHFAHRPSAKCAYASGETEAHMRGKQVVHDAFARRGLRVEVECRVLTSEGDRRADVLVWGKDGESRIAFEVQHSDISLADLCRRTKAYMAAGVRVIWLPLIHPDTAARLGDCRFFAGALAGSYAPYWHRWLNAYSGSIPFLDVSRGQVWMASMRRGTLYEGGWGRPDMDVLGPFDMDEVQISTFQGAGKVRRTYEIPAGPSAKLVVR